MVSTHWHWLKISGHVVALCNLAVTKACSQVGSVTNTDSVQSNGLKDYEIDDVLSGLIFNDERIIFLYPLFMQTWLSFHSLQMTIRNSHTVFFHILPPLISFLPWIVSAPLCTVTFGPMYFDLWISKVYMRKYGTYIGNSFSLYG